MRKKRILFCSEATFLNTGYATYTREILQYLYQTDKYELAELAAYGDSGDRRSLYIPWKFYGATLPRNASEDQKRLYQSKYSYQFGEYAFHDVCLDFKPDIVCDIRDFWMLEFVERSPYRPFFKWCIMPTVDAYPQARQWISTYQSADACLTYSDWAGEVLKKQSNGNINYLGSAPPSAHAAYCMIRDKNESRKYLGIPDHCKVVGTVMRNQRRKLYPDLFKAFRLLLDKVEDPQNYLLYCHTSYPDMGWDIPELLQTYNLSSNTVFTYVCTETKKPFASFFQGPHVVSPFTKKLTGIMSNVKCGIDYPELATIMNSFDIYVQYANSEGFGLPQVEAAACGIPVASVNYSAMESVVKQLGAIPLDVKALYQEMETGCMRAVPDNQDTAQKLYEFFQQPSFKRSKLGFDIKQNFLKYFQWDISGSVWERYFDSVEILDERETWFSTPRIFKPASKPDFKKFSDIQEYATFLIKHVLCKEEKINTFFHSKLVRDLLYGFTTGISGGVYQNDSSMIADGNVHKISFDFDRAYEYMLSIRLEENAIEQKRAEVFKLL
jgi:glycosyltransferase involved in cell wall biosynthesis